MNEVISNNRDKSNNNVAKSNVNLIEVYFRGSLIVIFQLYSYCSFKNTETMSKYIYLTCTPEALVASMLPPEGFGMYLSTGTKKRNKGQTIFFEVDLGKIENLIDMESLNKRCVAKEDGSPKSSVYLSVYRVTGNDPDLCLKEPLSDYRPWLCPGTQKSTL